MSHYQFFVLAYLIIVMPLSQNDDLGGLWAVCIAVVGAAVVTLFSA